MCSAVGVLSPEVGGLWDGVMETEAIPLMSMVGEVREDRGVSMVEGMVEIGGDFDFPLPDGTSSVATKRDTVMTDGQWTLVPFRETSQTTRP